VVRGRLKLQLAVNHGTEVQVLILREGEPFSHEVMRGQPRVRGFLFLKGLLGLKKVLQRLFQSFTLSSGCARGQR
jgi:hypothetical protein